MCFDPQTYCCKRNTLHSFTQITQDNTDTTVLPTYLLPSSARLVRQWRPRRLRHRRDIVARRFRPYLSTRRPVPLGALRETQPDMDGTITNVRTRQ